MQYEFEQQKQVQLQLICLNRKRITFSDIVFVTLLIPYFAFI